jgi:LPS export ABC transporter permease LptG/LPS export ABC transporter permease LptF
MRILSKYILRETLTHAGIGLGVFTFVLFLGRVGQILELVVRNSAPLPSVAELIFLALPTALTVTIPMGVLLGILIGLSRLAADSEVTAMRASGFGLGAFLRPLSLMAIGAWILASINTIFIAPRSAAALADLQDKLKSSQASFEVEPRVFYEDFPKMVLYVEDVIPHESVAVWRKVFLADMSDPSSPAITMAAEGVAATSDNSDAMRLRLSNGYVYETPAKNPDQSFTRGFNQLDLAIALPPSDTTPKELAPVPEMKTGDLYWQINHIRQHPSNDRTWDATRLHWYETEFHRRLALPAACLVLALVGIPLGLSAKKGGKAAGFVLTITIVFIYYFISLGGVSMGRLATISPALGVWMGNIIFLIAGLVLLWRANLRPLELNFGAAWEKIRHFFRRSRQVGQETALRLVARRRGNAAFPQILDDYVLRDFLMYVAMVLVTFLILAAVFNFFDVLSDIIRNRVPFFTVGEYLASLMPSMLYLLAPLCVLIAVLITFGLMEKANEITAMKACGISVYRAMVPMLALAAVFSAGLYFFNEYYLPSANRESEALRNTIKGKPAQTFLRPDRMWIFGKNSTIYYYEYFDADKNSFGNISVFEFDPDRFDLTKRVYAARAHWEPTLDRFVFEKGWERSLNGSIVTDYRTFDVSTFPELTEDPGYFKKEIKQYTEMSSGQLRSYIHDMERSGFDVVRLKVQLWKKYSYPTITLVMAILAVPFSLKMGRKGALAGVAVALGIAIVYLIVSNLFEAMGNVSQLPPALAAWAPDMFFAFAGGYFVLKVPT